MKSFAAAVLVIVFAAFSPTEASAANARIFGEYSIRGWYEKNHSLLDKSGGLPPDTTVGSRGSTAFYTQQLRMGIDFMLDTGLMLGTRFDALDRKWMAARRPVPTATNLKTSTDSEQENIGIEVAYLVFNTPIGRWSAGTHAGGSYSTGLGGTTNSINWTYLKGPWMVGAMAKKGSEISDIGTGTDTDSNTYSFISQYRWSTGSIYFRFSDVHSRANSGLSSGAYTTDWYVYIPVFKQKFKKAYFEWEINYVTGWSRKYKDAPPPGKTSVKADKGLNSRMKLNVDLAPWSIGGYFVYNRGDDPNTPERAEGNFRELLDYDRSFNPCLILWNENYMQYLGGDTEGTINTGTLSGNAGTKGIKTYLDNVWMYQINGSYKFTPKLTLAASLTYAYADKKPTIDGQPQTLDRVSNLSTLFVSRDIGKELDVIATYRIYDNLEYMLGLAYLWTGDYFKGNNPNARTVDDYLLTHKLTLTF